MDPENEISVMTRIADALDRIADHMAAGDGRTIQYISDPLPDDTVAARIKRIVSAKPGIGEGVIVNRLSRIRGINADHAGRVLGEMHQAGIVDITEAAHPVNGRIYKSYTMADDPYS